MTRLYPPAVDTAQMEQEYAALYEGVALVDNRAAGRLYLHDRDRTRLLHRLSTNDIEGLQPGQGTRTVLTNHNGRIIDLLTVHLLPVTTSNEPPVLLVTSAEQRQSVRKLLHRNIFFGDRLQIEDISESLAQLMLYGPHSCALVQQLLGVPAAALPRYDIMAGHLAGIDLFVSPVAPIGGCGFALYIPVTGDTGPSTVERIWQALLAAGAQPVGPNTLMTAWVEAGYATYGRELSLEYIPLETGLMDAMSFTKGCYIGQEIIERMRSRQRIARKLRGLKLSQPVAAPVLLEQDGNDAGTITSAVVSPRYGPIALAYVRTAYADPGTLLHLAGYEMTAEVVALPFIRAD